jgi:starvation-inducible DNA-binding protein
LQIVQSKTQLPAYPLAAVSGREHNEALAEVLAAFGATSRAGIDAAAAAGDAGTTDLFTEVSRAIDKMLWKIEAHLQAKS